MNLRILLTCFAIRIIYGACLWNWDDYHSEQPEISSATFVGQSSTVSSEEKSPSESSFRNQSMDIESTKVPTGLEELEVGAARVTVDEKAMINCRADLNQLVPFKYDWAWQIS
jgi:ribonucleoside-diphosphate reductase beta chain